MITKQFLLAGHAIFTIEPSDDFIQTHNCNPHYTYKISDAKVGDLKFISLLTAPDKYTYLGILAETVKLTKNSQYTKDSIPFILIKRLVDRIMKDGTINDIQGWRFHHEGRCGRCGIALTTPTSVTAGFGPECRKILGID